MTTDDQQAGPTRVNRDTEAGQLGGRLDPELAAAIEATATAYTEDPALDVEARLRSEAEQRGLSLTEGTVSDLAREVLAGRSDGLLEPPPTSS
jgi:hypothetical protein